MKLESLTLENFKSYKGTQVIGPFSALTAIIGPNGSGKSNLMDALSFVLGIKSSNLRCSSMQELVHNGQSSASVTAVFTKNGEKFLFSRRIVRNASEFRINEQQLTWQEYNARLQEENILTRAKNFLVFQGDVESIAAQSPKDLTRLIETISGSYELKEEYERLKEQTEKATENSSVNFNKKKSVTAELKLLKEQKEDATKFRGFTSKKVTFTTFMVRIN
jgi:structural maintenance of chromosome 1